MEKDDYQNLFDYSLRLLSFRPRSTKEISDKLKKFAIRRNFPDHLITQVIGELKEHKYLDDAEFSRWWKEQRQSYKPKGEKAIKMELLQKGIDREIIEAAFTDKKEGVSEYDLAMKVVNKKLIHLKYLPVEKLKIKVRDLLFRRGFDWDTISKVIDSVTKKS